jgi:hypothetical protein
MKGGDISNVSSPQAIVVTDVIVGLKTIEERVILKKKITHTIGELDKLSANKLWVLSNNYGLSLELAGFEEEGWTEELLDKAFSKLERQVVNPFNYYQLYENVDELVGALPYRANLKAVIDVPGRVARYGSAGVELGNI